MLTQQWFRRKAAAGRMHIALSISICVNSDLFLRLGIKRCYINYIFSRLRNDVVDDHLLKLFFHVLMNYSNFALLEWSGCCCSFQPWFLFDIHFRGSFLTKFCEMWKIFCRCSWWWYLCTLKNWSKYNSSRTTSQKHGLNDQHLISQKDDCWGKFQEGNQKLPFGFIRKFKCTPSSTRRRLIDSEQWNMLAKWKALAWSRRGTWTAIIKTEQRQKLNKLNFSIIKQTNKHSSRAT